MTDSRSTPGVAQGRLFYGWVIVGAVFAMLVVSSGLGFYNAPVILAAATGELDASVGSVSGATGLFFAIGGMSGFVLSRWMDTIDIRIFFVAGGMLGGAALAGLRWVDSVPALYLFFALFGAGFGLAGIVPAITLVTRWFDRRRSVALSIASTGLSVGGIILTPVAAWLIDRRGLSGAGLPLAALWVAGILPLGLLLLRSRPADMGLTPDGDPTPARQASSGYDPTGRPSLTDSDRLDPDRLDPGRLELDPNVPGPPTKDVPPAESQGATFAQARRTRYFVAMCLAYAAIFFGQVGAIAQMFKMVQERTDTETAGTALSVLALASVLARLVGGALVLRVSTRGFTIALAVAQAVGLVLLAFVTTPISLVLGAAFLGVSVGNLLMLQPLLLAEAFGVRQYSRIYSFSQLFGTLGVAGGPLALGVIRDASDYQMAFVAAAVASVAGALTLGAAGSTNRIRRRWYENVSPTVSI